MYKSMSKSVRGISMTGRIGPSRCISITTLLILQTSAILILTSLPRLSSVHFSITPQVFDASAYIEISNLQLQDSFDYFIPFIGILLYLSRYWKTRSIPDLFPEVQ